MFSLVTYGGRWILYIWDRQTRLSTQITEDGVAVSKPTRHSDAHRRDPGQKGASHFVLHSWSHIEVLGPRRKADRPNTSAEHHRRRRAQRVSRALVESPPKTQHISAWASVQEVGAGIFTRLGVFPAGLVEEPVWNQDPATGREDHTRLCGTEPRVCRGESGAYELQRQECMVSRTVVWQRAEDVGSSLSRCRASWNNPSASWEGGTPEASDQESSELLGSLRYVGYY